MPGEYRRRDLIENKFVVTHVVDDHHEGWRADMYLRGQYRFKSRNQLQRAIEEGRILITGKRLKPSTILRSGDEIKVITTRDFQEPPVNFNYKVLYEDDYLIALDKPGNLPVHPAGRFLFNTLLMQLRKERADWLTEDGERNFFLIHRLDRETSGVLLMAKQRAVANSLVKQFFNRQTEKRYYAVVVGRCAEKKFSVDADIGPAQGSEIRLKMGAYPKDTHLLQPESGVMSALTHFEVVRRGSTNDLVECKLETGRQHQIRVHLAHVGNPVVGDKLYGGREDLFLKYIQSGQNADVEEDEVCVELEQILGSRRQALHSRSLRFFHEPRQKWIEVESPLPQDLEELL